MNLTLRWSKVNKRMFTMLQNQISMWSNASIASSTKKHEIENLPARNCSKNSLARNRVAASMLFSFSLARLSKPFHFPPETHVMFYHRSKSL
jgi:hypothetical protein